ncbi:MAG: hypothetical protein IPK07_34220 [Deltaproteobacteria bacterium]|nr:hypothetical protein [Deltaproteobacteria bacterium]
MNPARRASLLAAVRSARGGDWQRAHVLVQDHDDEPLANWIHAVVHRMEGDAGNAAYWFRRCGRPFGRDLPIDAELREIERALEAEGATP